MNKNELIENEKFDIEKMNGLSNEELDVIQKRALAVQLERVNDKLEKIEITQNNQGKALEEVKHDLNNKITLDYGQQAALQHAKKKRVEELWKLGGEFQKVLDTKRKLHARAWSELYRSFGVSSYRDVKSKDFEEAMEWINVWRPQIF